MNTKIRILTKLSIDLLETIGIMIGLLLEPDSTTPEETAQGFRVMHVLINAAAGKWEDATE